MAAVVWSMIDHARLAVLRHDATSPAGKERPLWSEVQALIGELDATRRALCLEIANRTGALANDVAAERGWAYLYEVRS